MHPPRRPAPANDLVSFGYTGQRTADVSTGIRTADVAWLVRYLGQITDRQLREMLEASGADDDETDAFADALRERIAQLHAAAGRSAGPTRAARSVPTHP